MVTDTITPKIAPATARTAMSSGLRPVRLAIASASIAMVRERSSRARARTSGILWASSEDWRRFSHWSWSMLVCISRTAARIAATTPRGSRTV